MLTMNSNCKETWKVFMIDTTFGTNPLNQIIFYFLEFSILCLHSIYSHKYFIGLYTMIWLLIEVTFDQMTLNHQFFCISWQMQQTSTEHKGRQSCARSCVSKFTWWALQWSLLQYLVSTVVRVCRDEKTHKLCPTSGAEWCDHSFFYIIIILCPLLSIKHFVLNHIFLYIL